MFQLTSEAAVDATLCVPIFNTLTTAQGGTRTAQGYQRRQTDLPLRSPPMSVAGVPGVSRCVVLTDDPTQRRLKRTAAHLLPVSRTLNTRLAAATDTFEAEVGGPLRGLLAALMPCHDPSKVAILRSSSQCERQLLHTDYSPRFGELPLSMVPFGAILAVQPDTRLVVARGSCGLATVFSAAQEHDAECSEQRNGGAGEGTAVEQATAMFSAKRVTVDEVALCPGDLCIFRGDLVHAGSAYDNENVRVHVYIVPRGDDPPVDETHPVPESAAFAFVQRQARVQATDYPQLSAVKNPGQDSGAQTATLAASDLRAVAPADPL